MANRSLILALFFASLVSHFAWPAPGPVPAHAPIIRLQSGLGAEASNAAVLHLITDCFDLPRIARYILAGLPGANAQAESRLVAVLERRLSREMRRHPPLPSTMTWIEDRAIGRDEWLVLTQVPNPGGDPHMLTWRVINGPAGPRIIDLMRDGVSGMRTRRSGFASLVRQVGLEGALAEEEAAAQADITNHGP